MSYGNLQYYPALAPGFGSKPRLQSVHPFRNLVAAGSNMNNQWSGASGHPDYGLESPDYDYHSGPSGHIPSGGSYSYHATGASGYGPPAPPAAHPPDKPSFDAGGGVKKGLFGGAGGKRGSSAVSALTLLSFLFFINLLQGCIKDHMDAMNPTVMVMTTNIIRNRFNKMGEINSREQGASYTSDVANVAIQSADLAAGTAAQSASIMEATRPSAGLNSPYNDKPVEQAIQTSHSQYVHKNSEPQLPINYAPHQYNAPEPAPYGHLPFAPPTIAYDSHTLIAKPSTYKLPPFEQHYNYDHAVYSAQPAAQASVVSPQYSSSQNPFYAHQLPVAAKPYNSDSISPYQQTYSNVAHHPWSSNLHTSSSVAAGPFRRASIIALSPKTRWITVPAKITDHTYFNANIEDNEEDNIKYHDDRDVFHSRFN